jgi:hypothetical protein
MSLRRNKLANACVLSSEERVGRSERFRATVMLLVKFGTVVRTPEVTPGERLIPAKTEMHSTLAIRKAKWIPACAGMPKTRLPERPLDIVS